MDLDRKIYQVSREYKISILPITPQFDIDNLYPLTDHVELWNIFVVGNDKTYILANINDLHIHIPNHNGLHNQKGEDILPSELVKVFDTLWDRTLSGRQLQFYMVWNGKLYFMNTYPFFNGAKVVIGAILFMRAFETMPETRFATYDGNIMPVRFSEDRQAGPKAPLTGHPAQPGFTGAESAAHSSWNQQHAQNAHHSQPAQQQAQQAQANLQRPLKEVGASVLTNPSNSQVRDVMAMSAFFKGS
jgi:hypothetical protein